MAQVRFATVTTPLGEELRLRHMRGGEGLGELFAYELELISDDPNIDDTKLVGQGATVNLSLPNGKTRYFNGIISSFGFVGTKGRFARYHMTLRPWLWLLSLASDCQIFQRLSVPDVVRKIFGDHGFSDYNFTLHGDYRQREYVVQYRETTLSFLDRLLQREGIYYYFKHEAGRHSLELVDGVAAHETQPDYEKVPFFAPGKFNETDYIETWAARRQIRTGSYAFTDFDFTESRANLALNQANPGQHPHADKECYDYPGNYETIKDGERYIRTRVDELVASELGFTGSGTTRGLGAGVLFELMRYPRDKLNCQYLIVAAQYAIDAGDYESRDDSDSSSFVCNLHAVDSSLPYVARRLNRRHTVAGPQTATVVGAKGTEIWTDEYARVKVQFHWDRVGKRDESSSCWVRVAQNWGGAGWGSIHIPRIGQEVIVEFLEGDPDRPIITGRVYNDANMPPYALPRNQTQSGIKTHSTPGGGANNFNELRFEDKTGQEQLYMQAEKNMDTLVKNDQSLTVGANRKKTVTGREDNKVDGGRETTIEKFDNLTVNSANKNTTVHGQFNTVADEHYKVQQKATQLYMKDRVYVESDGDIEFRNGGTHYRGQQSGKLSISVSNEVSITCGAASITLKKDGTVEIIGTNVTVGTKTNKAQYAPAGITVSAAKISQMAIGIHEVNGAIVKIG